MADPENLRIVFAGTPDFAVPPLKSLIENDLKPVAVLTQPDRPAGRGRRLQGSPVKIAAEKAGIAVLQPATLKSPPEQESVASLEPDLIVVVAYGLILPREILECPKHGCWNIHASLLPRWRGAAPIQRAIEAGDGETGVCIMQMDEGLDTGPILGRAVCPIDRDETAGSLHDKLAELGARELIRCIRALQTGSPPQPRAQPEEGVCYARKLVKSEAKIDWQDQAEVIERRIRAFDPWPVAWCMINGERTRIWAAEVIDSDHKEPPGRVLAVKRKGFDVACGDGVVRLKELQRPGGRRISAQSYLNAARLPDLLED
jgi:methionyl-tRNA formyltransferase